MFTIKDMRQFQELYYPSRVGKDCPYCGQKYPNKKLIFELDVRDGQPPSEIHFVNKKGKIVGKIINNAEGK